MQAAAKRAKRSVRGGELQYDTEVVQGAYVSTVSSSTGLIFQQYSGEAAALKKPAEHAAAKVALEAEFPEVYASLVGGGSAVAAPGAPKRKMNEWGVPEQVNERQDGKSKLMHAVQLILQRPLTKQDIVYETVSLEEGNPQAGWVSTLRLPELDPNIVYEGERCESKKGAEASTAEAAFATLQGQMGTLEERRRQKKAAEAKKKREGKKEAAFATLQGQMGTLEEWR